MMNVELEYRLHSMEEGIACIAKDLSIIKCLLISWYSGQTGRDAQRLAEDIEKIYSNRMKESESKGD